MTSPTETSMTMSNELTRVSADVQQVRVTIASALKFVAGMTGDADAEEAYDRIKLAREWAKIRKISKQVHADLLRLEIHCLRKIANLGPLGIIDRSQRGAALFFKDKTDAEIDALIAEFGEGVSPAGVVSRQNKQGAFNHGRDWVTSGDYARSEPQRTGGLRKELVDHYLNDSKAALASILENYEADDEGFSIYDLTDELIASLGLDDVGMDWGVREGLTEVCRKAVRDAPDVLIDNTKAPRFITCIESGVDSKTCWTRVPFHSATLAQLDDMVELRQDQAEAAQKVASDMNRLRSTLAGALGPSDRTSVLLVELAARIALHTAA